MGPPEMATHRAPIIDKPISEEPTKPYRATTINPITLSFADPEMEMELRAGIVDVAQPVVALFLVLNLVLNMLAGYQTTLVHIILFATYGCAVLAIHRVPARERPFDAHSVASSFWVLSWTTNICAWWAMLWSGMIRRLNRDEGQQAAACCAIWILVTVAQHVVHIPATHRAVILALALPIVLTAPHWQSELAISLVIGEAAGYCIEHMLRASYLRRAERLEQLREEKERVAYDFMLLEKREQDTIISSIAAGLSPATSQGKGRGRSRTPPGSATNRRPEASEHGGEGGGHGASGGGMFANGSPSGSFNKRLRGRKQERDGMSDRSTGSSGGTNSELAGYSLRSKSPGGSSKSAKHRGASPRGRPTVLGSAAAQANRPAASVMSGGLSDDDGESSEQSMPRARTSHAREQALYRTLEAADLLPPPKAGALRQRRQ